MPADSVLRREGYAGPGLLGIDLGTSSVKVVLTDPLGHVVAQAARPYPVSTPAPGYAETDPVLWRHSITDAVRETTAQAPEVDVAGIGLSGQMHGVVAVGEDLNPLRPAVLWADSRATDQLDRYRLLPARLSRSLHNPITAGMAGPILAWLAEHEPATGHAMRWALQPKDWVRAWLTGEIAAEPSDASATLLYDLDADSWAVEVADRLGIDSAVLPPLLPSAGARAGTLTAICAAEFGLSAGIPVAAGGADTAVAALGAGLTEPGTAQLTIGTGAQIISPTVWVGGPNTATEPTTHLYRTATTSGHYRMAASLNGGLALTWVCQTLGASWTELYSSAASPLSPDAPLFLPHLYGERTPYLSSTMTGAWLGLAPHHTRTDLLRAALEGVAYSIRDAMTALFPGDPPSRRLRLAGGGTAAAEWRQMLADVLDVQLYAVEVTAASGRGAALLGGQSAGLFDETHMLNRLAPALDLVAEPTGAWSETYQARYLGFRTATAQLNSPPTHAADLVGT